MRLCRFLLIAALIVAVLVGAFLVWANADRLFGRVMLPSDSLVFAEQISQIRASERWTDRAGYAPRLTRADLLESRRLGCRFLVANQRPEGNFNYEYDFVKRTQSADDNQVRQAGALWGVALCHQAAPTPETEAALHKGFDFFFQNTGPGRGDSLAVYYPGEKTVATGTVALVALALIDYLRTEPAVTPERRAELEGRLDGYLRFLRSMQLPAGDFSYGMTRGVKLRVGRSSPYFDGEAQLALAKAAKYLGRTEYVSALERAAAKTAPKYTVDAWRKDRDSDLTKGFYQWSSMAFWEYQDAGWPHGEVYGDTVLALGWWMIYTHRILNRTRNTGYAYEGLIHAYRVAAARGDQLAAGDLRRAIDKGLYALTTWQVGGPLAKENRFLRAHPTDDPLAVGGIMNHRSQPGLRIDVTQHQMHAVILALTHIYTE